MMTLVILTWLGFFTLPLVYKNNQVRKILYTFREINLLISSAIQAAVDDVIGQVNTQITDIKEKIAGVIPMKSKILKKEE